MAKRYSGTVEINIRYSEERECYDATLTEINDDCQFEPVLNVNFMLHRLAGYDRAEAYDKVAEAVLEFASYEDESIYNFAEFTSSDVDEFLVRRKR